MFTLRPPTEADIPQLLRLSEEESFEARRPHTTKPEDILEDWSAPGQDRERFNRVAVVDDEIVASANIYPKAPVAWLGAFVAQKARRQGIGTAIWEWMTDTFSGLDGIQEIEAGHRGGEDGSEAFIQSLGGFEFARSFLRMRNTSPHLIAKPEFRGGVELWTPRDHVAETLALRNTSFQDHWGFEPWTEDEVRHRINVEGQDTDLWFYAKVDGRPAGFCLNRIVSEADGTRHGFLGPIGTKNEFRGRGIARVLLRHSVAELAKRGTTSVTLWVDSENPFQATKLYRDNGFELHSEWRVFRRPLAEVPVGAAS